MANMEIFVDYGAGALSGCAGVVFGHPLDTVKVQIQVQQSANKYRGLWHCCTTLHSRGLVHGFFRGLSWPLLSYGVVNSVFFGTYSNVLKLLGGQPGGHSGSQPQLLPILGAGAVGGVVQLTIGVPVEVIKVVLQAQIPHGAKTVYNQQYYKGPIQGMLDIIRTRGVRGMYRGLVTQFCRDIPASAAYFSTFEFSSYYTHKYLPYLNSQLINFFAGGLAGVLSWTLIMPFDVIKCRCQGDVKARLYTGLRDCAIRSFQEEGLKGAKKVSKPASNKMMATPPQTQQTEGPQYPQNSALVTTYCPPNAFAQMATSPQSQQIGGPQNNTLPTNAMQNSQMQGQQNIMTAYGPPNAFAQGAIEYPSNNVQMASAPQSQQRGGPQNNTLPANAMQNAHMLGPQNIMTAYGPSNAFGAVEYPANSVQMANSPQSQQIGGPQNNTLPANVMQNAQMQGPHNLMTAYGSPNAFAQGAALFDTDY